MKHFKVKYINGKVEWHSAKTSLELIKRLDLATAEHINTIIVELEGEQQAIAIANEQEKWQKQ